MKDKIRTDINVIICPSFIYLPYFNGKYNFSLGSQSLCPYEITGESTAEQLKSVGVKYSLIGHFERKKYFIESNKFINDSIKEAIKNNIIPLVCVGETKEQYLRKKTGEVIINQLKEYFYKIDFSYDIVIIYEPGWELDKNNTLNVCDIKEVINLIKNTIIKSYNINPIVLYGGNVNKNTINTLSKINNIDGYLIGKSSISQEEVIKILDSVN